MAEFSKSPLYYTGGYKILEHIIPSFPLNIYKFVDLFAGGFNVGINVQADTIYVNDQITYLIDRYSYFKETNIDEILGKIKERILEYGLMDRNADGYLKLRNEYNQPKNILDLFLLTCFSFNHQIRYNNKHEFNTPFGKQRSSYNSSIEHNLINFVKTLQEKNITTGSYNDGKRGSKNWTEVEEIQLLRLLDSLNDKGYILLCLMCFITKAIQMSC